MSPEKRKVSLIYFVIATLLLVGLVPLVLTGWFLSDKSGRELRAAENRYQIQLVQEKARHIEMFGKRFGDLVSSISIALELSDNVALVSSAQTERKLGSILRENPDLLALYVKPLTGESLSVFRSETISKMDVESISEQITKSSTNEKLQIGNPQKISTSGEFAMAFASSVEIAGSNAAEVVAIVSLRDIRRSIVGTLPTREEDLWESGLPIIFVVDQTGAAVFHPDQSLVSERRPLGDLKIVGEWLDAGENVQSALVPFSAEFHGKKHEMIGAYSTVNLSKNTQFGVITMQDESKALASVGEMRAQTWLISMIFALCALIVGFIGARFMTAPDTAADHRMCANDAVVANLHLIIDLDAVFDDRIVNRTAIDRRTCADFHIRADADSAKLSNFALDAGAISRIAKPVRTDDGRTVHHGARTKPHARIQCHVRPKPDILRDDAVRADVAMRANHRTLTNTHTRLNNSTGSN